MIRKKDECNEVKIHSKLGYIMSKKVVTFFLSLLFCCFILAIENYGLNIVKNIENYMKNPGEEQFYFGIQNCYYIDENINKWIYVAMIMVAIGFSIKVFFDIQRAYASIDDGQKGVARWTTFEEIQEQYKEIPLKTDRFPGNGGLPVAEYKDKIYIDDTPVNNLIIGITRSGKGEMYVFKMIDIYSRAEKQASLVVTDPKLELAPSSKETLEKRGYEVHVLNLAEPKFSMGYNPLKLIIDAYKRKDFAEAELLCSTFCYSIFNAEGDNDGDSKFFANTSTYLLSALILAHIEDCLKEDEEENLEIFKEYKRKRANYDKLDDEEKVKVKEKFDILYKLKDKKRRNSKDDTQIEQIELELKDYAVYKERIEFTYEHEKNINMYSIICAFSTMANIKLENNETALDYYFNSRPDSNRAKLLYSACGLAGAENKGTVFANTLASLNLFSYEDNAKMTAESTIEIEDIGYGKKPMAVFISMPDYDKSNHFIASVFIRQLYFVLAKKALDMPDRKCTREVIFLLDEFGNMPAIEGMASIITVCLGRNIKFDLVIQSYAQLKAVYKDDADTISGNCGNQVYIQTEDVETAENYSKRIGKKTVVNVTRSGDGNSMKKNYSESVDERELLNPNELMNLVQGQCVIVRAMKRKDLKGRDVKPRPIFNKEKTKLKFRYMYMLDDFPSDLAWKNMDNIEKTVHVEHEKRVFDFRTFIGEKKSVEVIETQKKDIVKLEKDIYEEIKDEGLYVVKNFKEIIERVMELSEEKGKDVDWELFEKGTIEEILELMKEMDCYEEIYNMIVNQDSKK